MKTMKLLDITANAISTVTTAINMVMEKFREDTEIDHRACELKGDNYMILSESMSTVRELLKEFPEELISKQLADMRDDFYIHLHGKDDIYNLSDAHSACHKMHKEIYDMWFKATEALRLYS